MSLSLAWTACSSDDDTDAGTENTEENEDNSETEVTAASGYDADYESQGFFSKTTNVVVTAPPHERVRIFYSDDLTDLIDLSTFTAPVGATAIKEAYDEEGNIANILVMTKQEAGYDSANGDWYYEMRSADGTEVMNDGKIEMCINCHTAAAAKDYLPGTQITDQ